MEIADTAGAELGLHYGASSLGIEQNVQAFHTLSVSWAVMFPGTVCPHAGVTRTNKVYPLQEADNRRKAEDLLRNY